MNKSRYEKLAKDVKNYYDAHNLVVADVDCHTTYEIIKKVTHATGDELEGVFETFWSTY